MDTFSIAFVCTGNRFRSPLAEAFVHRLTLGLPVTVSSYGTLSSENAPPLPEAVEIALSCGISLADHRTRYVNNASLEKVDLLLGFEPAHIRQAVVDAQAPRKRSFTIGDFVPLLPAAGLVPPDEDVVKRARSLVATTGDRLAELQNPKMSSMRDPFGGSWKVYRQTASDVRDLSVSLVERLFGVADVHGLPPIPERLGRTRKKLWR
ncbi:MAG: arsenate reductase/protein-tyrosine-phosphatase family protein [Gaiellaceae bacterium]